MLKPPRDCLENAMLMALGMIIGGFLLVLMRCISLLVYGG